MFESKEIERAKADLLARARALGHSVTAEDDLHILADGQRIEPVRLAAHRVAFMVPPGCSDIRLQSRTFVPAQTVAASRDLRNLGICVARLQLDGAEVALDDEAVFAAGEWNGLERRDDRPCQRWTRANASLPRDTKLVVIDLAGRGYYWAPREKKRSVEMRASA